jgi:chromosomal replication initiation ATPase DnaA
MASARGERQLVLALAYEASLTREDFLDARCNAAALALVEQWPDWGNRVMALVGPEGSGKSHLAAIWAARARARVVAAHALDESDIPDALSMRRVVLEDLPEGVSEQALFHLLNLAREQQAFVLMTARTLPAAWPVRIPDLGSRLRAIPVTVLEPPDDQLLRAVLIKLFVERQLAVDESLVTYLLSRIERSFAAVRAIVCELDREALRLKRPITKALAAEALGRPPPMDHAGSRLEP